MFTYRIWLKSGACIEGEMDEPNAEHLKYLFIDKHKTGCLDILEDSDGELFIDSTQIDALSVSNGKEKASGLGFDF